VLHRKDKSRRIRLSHSLFGPATTKTDIKRQKTGHSPLAKPVHLFPDRKIKNQQNKTSSPMTIIASKS
jgi:hypothetical protein